MFRDALFLVCRYTYATFLVKNLVEKWKMSPRSLGYDIGCKWRLFNALVLLLLFPLSLTIAVCDSVFLMCSKLVDAAPGLFSEVTAKILLSIPVVIGSFHVLGHQNTCQLQFGAGLQAGLGLTSAEECEQNNSIIIRATAFLRRLQ